MFIAGQLSSNKKVQRGKKNKLCHSTVQPSTSQCVHKIQKKFMSKDFSKHGLKRRINLVNGYMQSFTWEHCRKHCRYNCPTSLCRTSKRWLIIVLQKVISTTYFWWWLKTSTLQNYKIIGLGRKLPFSLRQHLSESISADTLPTFFFFIFFSQQPKLQSL